MPQQSRKDSRPHGPRLTRRQFLAGTLATAGTAFLSRTALGQSPPPPIDTTKVPGFPAGLVGMTTPFEPLERLRSGRHTWFAPLDRFFGTVTPSGLHFVVSHGGPGTTEYLHMACSLVVTLIVTCVVPAGSVPDGCAPDLTGGMMSATPAAEMSNDMT